MTVRELLARIDSHELSEWIAFFQLEPFGTEASYIGHAITAATVANVSRGKRHKAYKPDDFMPKFKRKIHDENASQAIAFAEMFTLAHGGKDLRK